MVGIYGMFCSLGLAGRGAGGLVLGAAVGRGWARGGRLAVNLATTGSLL